MQVHRDGGDGKDMEGYVELEGGVETWRNAGMVGEMKGRETGSDVSKASWPALLNVSQVGSVF